MSEEAKKVEAEALKAKEEADAKAKAEKEPKTFTQEDLDRVAGERAKRAEEKAKKELADTLKKQREEWEAEAKLSAEEKETKARAKREAESADREREITLRENRADARETLQSKNISSELVDFIVDVDKDKTNDNIETFEKVYLKAVEAGVAEKLKGKTPEEKDTKKITATDTGVVVL